MERHEFNQMLDNPKWYEAEFEHRDWRNYVAPKVREVWEYLSPDVRMMVYVNAVTAMDDDHGND